MSQWLADSRCTYILRRKEKESIICGFLGVSKILDSVWHCIYVRMYVALNFEQEAAIQRWL